jgi:hypothetical protein
MLATIADEWLRTHSAVKLRSHDDNVERWKRPGEFFGKELAMSDVIHNHSS